jgi:CubicO group peptidase (beta-lactamase class C family)
METKLVVRSVNRQMSIYIALLSAALFIPTATGHSAHADLSARLDSAITSAQKRAQIPAISVALYSDGDVRYARAFGFADLENQVAASPTTKFRTASVAKPMTATAVMKLAESGKLDLDAPIQKYCPEFPQKPWPITARQLLGHLAGIRHYTKPGESAGTEHFFTIADSLRLFKHDPLLHEPGAKHEYSTYGYSVLGCAIEGASRQSYVEFVQQNVLEPAGMAHTSVDELYLIIPERARGYQLLTQEGYASLPAAAKKIARPNTVYNASLHDTSMKIAGGGWLSTPTDLVRFGAALLDGRLVKPETRDAMWTGQKTSNGKTTGYGLGFAVAIASNGRVAVTHGGNQAGASSALAISPAQKRVLAVMTNREDAPISEITREIIAIVNDNR